ncbi:MAG: hypothetical protein JXR75_03945 [Rhodobacteraceae bacterium]|nr:hypothetical protein [Paracoccaceae bacterium]
MHIRNDRGAACVPSASLDAGQPVNCPDPGLDESFAGAAINPCASRRACKILLDPVFDVHHPIDLSALQPKPAAPLPPWMASGARQVTRFSKVSFKKIDQASRLTVRPTKISTG